MHRNIDFLLTLKRKVWTGLIPEEWEQILRKNYILFLKLTTGKFQIQIIFIIRFFHSFFSRFFCLLLTVKRKFFLHSCCKYTYLSVSIPWTIAADKCCLVYILAAVLIHQNASSCNQLCVLTGTFGWLFPMIRLSSAGCWF